MAYSRDDVQPPIPHTLADPHPGEGIYWHLETFEVLDYNESLLTPPETVSNILLRQGLQSHLAQYN